MVAETMEPATVDVAANLAAVKARIAEAATGAGRAPERVTLVAVTKIHGPERIEPAIRAGHRVFGENRVQEAEQKKKRVAARAEWHFVGHLQSNKAGKAVALFDMVQSVDSARVAAATNRCSLKPRAAHQSPAKPSI